MPSLHILAVYDFSWRCFVVWALAATIVIRVVTSFLRTLRERHEAQVAVPPMPTPLSLSFLRDFLFDLGGFHPTPDRSDYLLTFLLGTLELVVYPILLLAQNGAYVIGAWLSFKALAQWRGWTESRNSFNHFLLINAVVVVVSYLLASYVLDPLTVHFN